jgi:HK97 family phage major capsid protein
MLTIPWALSEDYARRMLAIAQRQTLGPEAVAAELGEPLANTRSVTVREGVATIPIVGPMFRYADLFAEVSGATSYESLARDITAALEDSKVQAILFDVDSPGGEVFGAAELSDLIYNARGTKPIVGHVGGFCGSAALWVVSAADEVVVTSVGIMGSVGAMMSITVPNPDRQAELFGEQDVEFVSSQSPNKNIDPTSKAGQEQYQAIVDYLAGVFIADLARNYGVTEAKVLGKFGQGGLFVAPDAVKVGMASRVASFEATHQRLATAERPLLGRRPARMAGTANRLAALLQAVHLDDAIRPAAVLRVSPLITARELLTARAIVSDDGSAVADSPAPKADPQEDRTMAGDATAAAPASGAPDALADFKVRLASITNLCLTAGVPEKATEYATSPKSIADISAELMAHLRQSAGQPATIEVPEGTVVRVGADREADRPFTSLGEQLSAIAAAAAPAGVRIGAFVGGSVDKRLGRLNATISGGSTSVGGDGGFLVQKDFTVDLMKEAFGGDEIVKRCSATEIGANSDSLEVVTVDETSRATGSRWGGVQIYRVAEGGTATEKKPKIGKWERRLEDLMGVAYMTERLMQDGGAMAQVFREAFTDEFGFVVGDEVYRGTGAGQCLGLTVAACTVSVAKETNQAADTVVAENIMRMWARVLPRAKARGVWFINTEVTPQLDALNLAVGTGGALVYMPAGGLADTPYGRIKGRPVIEIEQASALGDFGDIAFADLTYYKLITKGGIQEAESIHVRFLYNERTFRWVSRVNGAPKLNSAITPYKGAAGAALSPFVMLAARA